MKTQDIFRKAGAILSEINEQYEYLSSASENLNDLELELLSANADFFAEHIRVLKKVNAASLGNAAPVSAPQNELPVEQNQIESIQIVSTPPPPLLIDDETLPEPLIKQETPETYFSFFPQGEPVTEIEKEVYPEEPEPIFKDESPLEPEPVFHAEEPVTIPETPVIPERENEPILENVAAAEEVTAFVEVEKEIIEKEKVINIDDLRAASEPPKAPTLNELIASRLTHNAVSDSGFNKKPAVTDLKSIINLNDKLTFIKDLFNGYSLAYSEAIEILNRFDSLDAADNFLKSNYAAKNSWATKQTTVDKFYELLNRRFAK